MLVVFYDAIFLASWTLAGLVREGDLKAGRLNPLR